MTELTYDRRDREQWNRRIAAMKRRKRRAKIRQWLLIAVAVLLLILAAVVVISISGNKKDNKIEKNRDISKENDAQSEAVGSGITVPIADTGATEGLSVNEAINLTWGENQTKDADDPDDNATPYKGEQRSYSYTEAGDMDFLGGDNMQSNKAILVNADSGMIVGARDHKARIVPASMTKVLTILVAAEHISDLSAKVPVSIEATDYAYKNDCSSVGFAQDESVTIEDLFYGTILSSGGDAAAQLAMYVAGTQEAFVEMMNEKLKELGISGTTHFTNTVGIYDDNHYSTCYDMAVIMNAAMDNELCRKVLSAHKYTTTATPEHPEGISISNWFLRRIEDKETGGEVIGAKTGYVVQSGNCGVSYFTDDDGTNYICVTADAHSAWRCIYDHVDIYLNHT